MTQINREVLDIATNSNLIPVIAPIGTGPDGESFNINADLVAGAIASALGAEKLILLTNIEGIQDASGTLLSTLTAGEVKSLIDEGTISGGMLPKIQCALDAVANGSPVRTSLTAGWPMRSCLKSSPTKASGQRLSPTREHSACYQKAQPPRRNLDLPCANAGIPARRPVNPPSLRPPLAFLRPPCIGTSPAKPECLRP